jgi:NADH-quinone oxidoreductase subunit E
MSNNGQTKEKIESAIEQAIQKHGVHHDAIIPILLEINQQLGYIPVQSLSEVRKRLQMPSDGIFVSDSRLFSIASFYHMLSTKPLGKHVVLFCESAPCHVVGGREVWAKLKDILKIKNGETTPDGQWSLVTTSCLGACGVGPVIVVDEDMYGNVTPDQVEQILSRYE